MTKKEMKKILIENNIKGAYDIEYIEDYNLIAFSTKQYYGDYNLKTKEIRKYDWD